MTSVVELTVFSKYELSHIVFGLFCTIKYIKKSNEIRLIETTAFLRSQFPFSYKAVLQIASNDSKYSTACFYFYPKSFAFYSLSGFCESIGNLQRMKEIKAFRFDPNHLTGFNLTLKNEPLQITQISMVGAKSTLVINNSPKMYMSNSQDFEDIARNVHTLSLIFESTQLPCFYLECNFILPFWAFLYPELLYRFDFSKIAPISRHLATLITPNCCTEESDAVFALRMATALLKTIPIGERDDLSVHDSYTNTLRRNELSSIMISLYSLHNILTGEDYARVGEDFTAAITYAEIAQKPVLLLTLFKYDGHGNFKIVWGSTENELCYYTRDTQIEMAGLPGFRFIGLNVWQSHFKLIAIMFRQRTFDTPCLYDFTDSNITHLSRDSLQVDHFKHYTLAQNCHLSALKNQCMRIPVMTIPTPVYRAADHKKRVKCFGKGKFHTKVFGPSSMYCPEKINSYIDTNHKIRLETTFHAIWVTSESDMGLFCLDLAVEP